MPMSERLTLPVLPLREVDDMPPLNAADPAFAGLHREARERAAELGQKSGLPDEVVRQVLEEVTDPGRLADLVAGYLEIQPAERQGLLETLSVEERLRRGPISGEAPVRVVRGPGDHQAPGPGEAGRGPPRGLPPGQKEGGSHG